MSQDQPLRFTPGDMIEIEEEFGDTFEVAFRNASVTLTHRDRQQQVALDRNDGEHIEDFMQRLLRELEQE